jgi:hypothetical protein
MKRYGKKLLLPLLVWFAGCAPTLAVVGAPTETPGLARVELRQQQGEWFTLIVRNLSSSPLAIEQDGFVLVSGGSTRRQEAPPPGKIHNVRPGSDKEVQLRFNVAGIRRGQTAQLVFPRALHINNQTVPVTPIELRAE